VKEIKAIIQPFMLGDVLHALADLESLPGVTVSQITGWGKSRARDADQVTIEGGHRMARKTKVEVVVPDELADAVVAAIATAARTGRVGDGKIFVTAIENTVQIRTGEQGEGAV
jgi:nitrogen regulatory protein P-II 1